MDDVLKLTKEEILNLFNLDDLASNPNIHYNYFSQKELTDTISSCSLITKCDIIPDIIDLISTFCGGIAVWSSTSKSKDINIT